MKAILDSLKAAARAAADRLKALWAKVRARMTVAAARATLTAQNIWRQHKTPILWGLAWIAFGTLTTLGLAGVYYTSPQARFWLEDTALATGKIVATPFEWLKANGQPQQQTVISTAVSAAAAAPPSPPSAPPAAAARTTYQIPIPPGQEKPAPAI